MHPASWDNYDTTIETKQASYSDRHLLLYSAVFWPWHFSSCEYENCQMLTDLWDAFVSGTNRQRWLDYHHRRVKTKYSWDPFWLRSETLQDEVGDLLSLVCVFGLQHKFTTVFESNCRERSHRQATSHGV